MIDGFGIVHVLGRTYFSDDPDGKVGFQVEMTGKVEGNARSVCQVETEECWVGLEDKKRQKHQEPIEDCIVLGRL